MTTCPQCHRPLVTAAEWAATPEEHAIDGVRCFAEVARDPFCAALARDLARKADADLLAAARCFPPGVIAAMASGRRGTGKPVVYLAHPVGAATVEGVRANLARAKRWLWALRCATEWSIVAPWIPCVEAVLDSGAEEHAERARGLADDLAAVERCDAIVLVGGRVSTGMAMERGHAVKCGLRVVDLTGLGEEPNDHAITRLVLARGLEMAAEVGR